MGDLNNYGMVYYNHTGIANILSMARVEAKGRRITYDSWDGGCFRVHNLSSGKIIVFSQKKGLYVWDTRIPKLKNDGNSFVNTVDENKKQFTTR